MSTGYALLWKGEFAESPVEEPCARAVSPSLESVSWDCSSLQCKDVQEHERRGGSSPNLHLCLFSHPVLRKAGTAQSLRGLPFPFPSSPFPFPSCIPTRMSKAAQKQRRMALLLQFQQAHYSLSTSSSASPTLSPSSHRCIHPSLTAPSPPVLQQ